VIGTQISHYRLDKKLGEGAHGAVYRGVHLHDADFQVAIKVVRGELVGDAAFMDALKRECKRIDRLEHPAVVRFRELSIEGAQVAMVMELLEGGDLHDRLTQGPLSLDELVRVTRAVLGGLGHAHSKGVLHRDIKPSNIFLCDDGRVKLLDFGVARAADNSHATRTGQLVGTLDYIAPERFSETGGTSSSDVYAMGLVVWEMLVGRPACPSGELARKLGWHMGVGPGDLRNECPDCPDWLAEMVAAFVDRDLKARPPDGAAALALLDQLHSKAATAPTAPTPAPAAPPPPSTVTVGSGDLAAARAQAASPPPSKPTAPGTVQLQAREIAAARPPSSQPQQRTNMPMQELAAILSGYAEGLKAGETREITAAQMEADGICKSGRTYAAYWKSKNNTGRRAADESGLDCSFSPSDRVLNISRISGRVQPVTRPPGRVESVEEVTDPVGVGAPAAVESTGWSSPALMRPSKVMRRIGVALMAIFPLLLVVAVIAVVLWPDSPAPEPNSIGMEFVRIEAGSFEMGSPSSESDRDKGERQHLVWLIRSFMMATTEVTQGHWQAVMGSNPSHFSDCGADCPVETVDWYDAVEFANALSKKEGLRAAYEISGKDVSWNKSANGYRLPTEAEWEYAARGGERHVYSGSNSVSAVGWTVENSGAKTHKVAGKQANAWGLYDMSGNVSEWCWDWYGKYRRDVYDPVGDLRGPHHTRVLRGGSWDYEQALNRVAVRHWYTPDNRGWDNGVRLVRTVP